MLFQLSSCKISLAEKEQTIFNQKVEIITMKETNAKHEEEVRCIHYKLPLPTCQEICVIHVSCWSFQLENLKQCIVDGKQQMEEHFESKLKVPIPNHTPTPNLFLTLRGIFSLHFIYIS